MSEEGCVGRCTWGLMQSFYTPLSSILSMGKLHTSWGKLFEAKFTMTFKISKACCSPKCWSIHAHFHIIWSQAHTELEVKRIVYIATSYHINISDMCMWFKCRWPGACWCYNFKSNWVVCWLEQQCGHYNNLTWTAIKTSLVHCCTTKM